MQKASLCLADFDAAAFDLDGVVTDTARLHEGAWKDVFDEFLEARAEGKGPAHNPFTSEEYRDLVDGRPRLDAVRAVFAARGIILPEGSSSDGSDAETVHGLGARKNQRFLDRIRTEGVDVYPSTIALIRRLRAFGVKIAVVSASRNCRKILQAARLDGLFDAVVDGLDIEKHSLLGKPAPDTFLEAARQLGAAPARTFVVEDATAGIMAARAGELGLVVGVDRTGHADSLRAAGADIVVSDLGQLELGMADSLARGPRSADAKPDVHRLDPFIAQPGVETRLPKWEEAQDPWLLSYDCFEPAVEGRRETLFALGNGYFVTRGAAAEARAGDVHYPGTYLAGGYNRLTTRIDGRAIEHEDLVNLPNWLFLTFRIEGGDWFDLQHVDILEYRQVLDLRRGLYRRYVRIRDSKGRRTSLAERRLVHMHDKHLASQHVAITAENWSGRLTIRAMLDGGIVNAGVQRYKQFSGRHYSVRQAMADDPDAMLLEIETTQSALRVAQAARLAVALDGAKGAAKTRAVMQRERVGYDINATLMPAASLKVEKIVALYTSSDRAIAGCESAARTAIARAGTFDELLSSHALAWEHLWQRCDVEMLEAAVDEPYAIHLAVRLHIFHLLQTASPHTIDLDVGIPPRGWHGEAYRGHIFWDELFIFPFLNMRLPVVSRALLR
jgi:beta-phosphoglucomutase family hydrolase